MGGGPLKEAELVIIGAGPGGIAAAVEATRSGVSPIVLDENTKAGGRIYWQFNDGFKVTDTNFLGPDYDKGRELLEAFKAFDYKIEHLKDAMIFGLFEDRIVAFQHDGDGHALKYKKLIVATGAYDRPVPFPGWTLPGVLTAGGAQSFVKLQRVLPGRNILLAGTGPLQLVVANQILDAGGRIEAVLEAGDIGNWLKLLKGFRGNWGLLTDGLNYMRGIRKARVPFLRRHIIVEAHGHDRVEAVVIAEVDKDWRPKEDTRRTLEVDTVCMGYGLVPSVDITRLAGCEHTYEQRLGGWVPLRQENMETGVPGVYAVGDGAGVAGSIVAVQEGRIAGIHAAQSLRYISLEECERRQRPFRSNMKKMGRVGRVLDDISVPRPGLYELARDDTVICRCEEITLKEIKQLISEGLTDINEIKRLTRMGMGRCQGRMCGQPAQEIIAAMIGVPPSEVGYLNHRPPTKPVPLSTLGSLPGEIAIRSSW
jgi:thioredoxin reductase/bacterioferritin-associated ferredoxin